MPAPKRARACDTCHSIKIKCELGSGAAEEPPCERCTRLGKTCIVSPPIRQKDRVAELEAKVEALTRLLAAQEIQVPETPASSISRGKEGSDSSPPARASVETSKKRRLEGSESNGGQDSSEVVELNSSSDEIKLELDVVVPRAVQVRILDRYRKELQPRMSLSSLATKGDYSYLRSKYPILLQTIVYCASSGFVSTEVQEDVSKVVIDLLTTNIESKKSLELVQALQLAAYWYCTPRHHVPISMFYLVELATEISSKLGLGNIDYGQTTPSPLPTTTGADASITKQHMNANDAWRTTTICYLYSAYMCLLRRIPSIQPWTKGHEESLTWLEYNPYGLPTDVLLCQLVRIIKLCEQISSSQNLSTTEYIPDISDPSTQIQINSLSNLIADWKAQIPISIQCPLLKIWERYATILIHEPVLHTGTNKESFTAPYLAERLSVSTFPNPPLVTPSHIISLSLLLQNCQSLLDLVLGLSLSDIMGFTPFFIVPQACFAQILLIKIYVAVTANGNSFGLYFDKETLGLEGYLEGMLGLGKRVNGVDERCGQARVLSSVVRVREWFLAYKESISKQNFVVGNGFDVGVPFEGNGLLGGNEVFDWDTLMPLNEGLDYILH